MSRIARDWAWNQQVSPTQKLLLLSLAEHANEAGECWPCGLRLQELTGLSVRAIRNAVRELEALELITCQRGSGTRSSRYLLKISEERITPDSGENREEEGADGGGTKCPPGGHEMPGGEAPDAGQGGTTCRGGGHEVPVRGARDAPGTVIEPS